MAVESTAAKMSSLRFSRATADESVTAALRASPTVAALSVSRRSSVGTGVVGAGVAP